MLFPLHSHAAAGDLDTTFGGGDGIVITTFDPSTDYFKSVAVQSDGKIVAAGYIDSGSGDILLARFNSDGSPDTSFGTGGVVTTAIGISTEIANALAPQSDGKIVVVGQAFFVNQYDMAVLRYNSNGSLDTTFGGGDGIVTTNTSAIVDNANAVAIQSNGNIWVGGTTWGGSNEDFVVVSYDSNGNSNGTFGGSGFVSANLGGTDRINAIAVQTDGKVVVAGSASTQGGFALARYNSNGSLDTGFDTDGIQTTLIGTSSQAYSLIIQPDNKILAGGFASVGGTSDFALARYNGNDGSLDSSFGAGGTATTPIGSSGDGSYAMARQTDGKIIMAGYATGGATSLDFALARFNSNGSLDTGYGSAGTVTTPIGVTGDIAYSIALQADGKAVVAGYLDSPFLRDSVLARYSADSLTTATIPTLSEWGKLIMSILLALGAVITLRRQRLPQAGEGV